MAKILHSNNYISYMIERKNKINYLKNGGGYMANTKIFKEDKQNFFDELVSFLKEQEKLEQNEKEKQNFSQVQETKEEDKKEDYSFEKELLEKEFDDAMGEFNLSYANTLKKKIDELNEKQNNTENNIEDFITSFVNLKNQTEDEIKNVLSNGVKDEAFLKQLIDFLVMVIKND